MTTMLQTEVRLHTITLELSEDLYDTAQEAVTLGLASSRADFIEGAIRQRAREVCHARMRRLADEAMADPGFVADLHQTMDACRQTDAEHWPTLDKV